jgi:hypoxanthine phosphoribosyltransferase
MPAKIKISDRSFEIYITYNEIIDSVQKMAKLLNAGLAGKEVVFIGVLNGSFMFLAELMQLIDLPCKVTFVKMASYDGDRSTGDVKQLLGINEDLNGKTVVVVEDIVDTGKTTAFLLEQLRNHGPEKIVLTALFFKPASFNNLFKIDYFGIEIPNDFIVGHGMDYNGFGRNLKDVYKLIY